jgi:RNA ligase
MNFPIIEKIEDVLPHIEGKTEFVVAEREGFTVINYMVAFDTTFPSLPDLDAPLRSLSDFDPRVEEYTHAMMLRECRGLMFDRDGKLISRPYAKFFNINEREETLASNYALEDPSKYAIMDKLDGSFIRPVKIDGIIRLCTKMGITDQSHQAEDFLETLSEEQQEAYAYFFETYVDHFTPIFEFCSRKNQVVIDYPEDELVLTGMRHNRTGDYITYKSLASIARVFKIPFVKQWNIEDIIGEGVPYCITRVVDAVRQWFGIEGVVVRFTDGRHIKIKALDYCEKHGAKDALMLEKNVLRFYLDGKIDDYLPLLDDAFRTRVDTYIAQVTDGINIATLSAEATVNWVKKNFDTRAEQARFIVSEVNPISRSIIFNGLDGKDIRKSIIDKVLSNTKTQNEVDEMRPFIGTAQWV